MRVLVRGDLMMIYCAHQRNISCQVQNRTVKVKMFGIISLVFRHIINGTLNVHLEIHVQHFSSHVEKYFMSELAAKYTCETLK